MKALFLLNLFLVLLNCNKLVEVEASNFYSGSQEAVLQLTFKKVNFTKLAD